MRVTGTEPGEPVERDHLRGRVGGRPTVVDDKRRAIIARRAEGQSLRIIAKGTEVSLAVVHRVISAHIMRELPRIMERWREDNLDGDKKEG